MVAPLRAGVATVDITPPPGIAHAGWGAQQHLRAEGVHLPLRLTALALEQDGFMVVLLGIDLCLLLPEHAAAMRETVSALSGIPPEHVRVAVTHTHAGPELGSAWMPEGREMVRPYLDLLVHQAAGAAWQAVRSLRPVRVAAGWGDCDVAVNRRYCTTDGRVVVGRNWQGFTDHAVGVVRLDTLDEQPYVTLLHYAAHPTILGPRNRLLSPDYPGVACRLVERVLGGTALFHQGAAGNQAARAGSMDGTVQAAERLGALLGCEAAKVTLGLRTRATQERFAGIVESGADLAVYAHEPLPEPDGTLRLARRLVDLPVRPVPPLAEAQVAADESAAAVAELRQRGAAAAAIQEATYRARRAHLLLRRARLFGGLTHRPTEVHALRIGPAALVGWPLEPFAEIGAAVKGTSPFPVTLFCGYTNGASGYLPVPEAYAEGGYEVDTSPYTPEAAGVVIQASRAALTELARPA